MDGDSDSNEEGAAAAAAESSRGAASGGRKSTGSGSNKRKKSGNGQDDAGGSQAGGDADPATRKVQNRISQRESRQRKALYVRQLEGHLRMLSMDKDDRVQALLVSISVILEENVKIRAMLASLAAYVGEDLQGGLMASKGFPMSDVIEASRKDDRQWLFDMADSIYDKSMAKAKEDTRAAPTAPMPREEQDKVTAALRQNLDNQRKRAGVVPPGHDATPAQAKSETPQNQQPPPTTRVTRQSASQSSSSAEPQSQAQRGVGQDPSPQPQSQPHGQPAYPQGSTSFSPSDGATFGASVGLPFTFPQTGAGTGTGASPDMFSEFLNIPGLGRAAASSASPGTTEMLANLNAYAGGASELGLPGMWQPPPQGSTPNSDSQSNNLLETQACQLISFHLRCRAENAFHPLPPALEPSFLQGIVTGYDASINSVLWPSIRDKLITFSNSTPGFQPRPIVEDLLANASVHPGPDLLDCSAWELSEGFIRRYRSLVDADVIAATNRWRLLRGDRQISL